MFIRTVLESGIDTFTKGVKLIPPLPHPILQHKPPMLNLIQVGGINRKTPNFTPCRGNHLLNTLRAVKASVVNHDDIPWLQLWHQALFQPHLK